MVNFGPLTAEICWRVWSTPANFNVFRVFASLLHRRRSTEVNQTLHNVLPSPGLVHSTYVLGPLPPNRIVPDAIFTRVQVLRPLLAALLHGTRAVGVSQTLRHGMFTLQGDHPIQHWAVELSSLVGRFALCYQTFSVCLSGLSCTVCDVGVLWPNGRMHQDETWHTGRPWPWPHCVGWGPSSPSPKMGRAPNFRPISVVA